MQINVNGQTYTSWTDVPEDVRKQLAGRLPDADGNGIPDLLEGNLSGLPASGTQMFTSISVNGQQVGSAGELPADVQQVLRQALGMTGAPAGTVPLTPPATTAPAAPAQPPQVSASGQQLQPGQIFLNGQVTSVSGAAPAKKGFFRRLFGG